MDTELNKETGTLLSQSKVQEISEALGKMGVPLDDQKDNSSSEKESANGVEHKNEPSPISEEMDTGVTTTGGSITNDTELTEQAAAEGFGNSKNAGINNDVDIIRYTMLDRVANSDGHFKHQQRGDPDLTFKEKREIASELLLSKPAVFLSRYGKFLKIDDIPYFSVMRSDYIIDFHVKEIERQCDDLKSKTKVRNRRYEAMKKLMDRGEYFSDEEMKSREPLLFEQMVGQYETEEERQARVEVSKGDLRFSTILEKHMDIMKNNMIYEIQKDIEEGQMEEDEDEEEEEEEETEDHQDVPSERISDIERQMLRNEFLRTMQLSFLNGEDREFDYSEVDGNVEYDSLDILGRDMEEKYFDEEDAESIHSEESLGPGRPLEDGVVDYEQYDVDQEHMQEDES